MSDDWLDGDSHAVLTIGGVRIHPVREIKYDASTLSLGRGLADSITLGAYAASAARQDLTEIKGRCGWIGSVSFVMDRTTGRALWAFLDRITIESRRERKARDKASARRRYRFAHKKKGK